MWDQITFHTADDIASPKLEAHKNEFSTFEAQVLVEISYSKNVTKKPTICYESSKIYAVVAINNKAFIFNDSCSKLIFEFETETSIDCFALADDSNLLLVAENAGIVHLIHLLSKKTLWSVTLIEKSKLQELTFKNVFICADTNNFLRVYILTTENILFYFSNLKALDLYLGIENGNYVDVLKDVKEVKIDLLEKYPHLDLKEIYVTSNSSRPLEVAVSCHISNSSEYYPVEELLDGEFHLQVDSDESFDQDELSLFPCNFFRCNGNPVKIICTKDCRYMFVLDTEHCLKVLCFWTRLCLFKHGDGNIHDFVVTETLDSTSSSVTDCKIILLVSAMEGSNLEIRQFPSFELIYSIRVSPFSKLFECKPNQEYWYIIEADISSPDFNESEIVSSLKIKAIYESLPATRLLRLVNRKMYQEAEKFAEIFKLDKEMIYQKKSLCVLHELSQSEDLPDMQLNSYLNELGDSLAKIKDFTFIHSCLCVCLPTMDQMEKLLLFLKQPLENIPDSEEKEKLISKINQYKSKLSTSQILSVTYSSMKWKEFLSLNLLDYMISKLSTEELDIAFIVWQRHKDELIPSLTEKKLQAILEAIPECMPSSQLKSFLCDDFMFTIFPRMPEAVNVTAQWLEKRAYLFEINEKDQWPNNAKELLEAFSSVINSLLEASAEGEMSFSSSSSLSGVYRKTIDADCVLGMLTVLTKQLQYLSSLRKDYGCIMSLADFGQEDKMFVVHLLLDRIDLKVMVTAVKEFIQRFALENELNLELCLEKYIEETLQSSYCTWWHYEEAPWEERLITVIDCIQDQTRWMEAALKIVFHAPLPWSRRIEELVKAGLAMDHPKGTDLKIQLQLLGLKQVLKKYELRDVPIKGDIQLAHTLINYVLKQNRDSAFEDVKEVLLAYKSHINGEDYVRWLIFFLNQNKIDEMIEILSSFSVEESIYCAEQLLQYIYLNLECRHYLQHKQHLIKTMSMGGVRLFRYLNSIKVPVENDKALILTCMQKLHSEFGIYPTLSDLSSETFSEETLILSIDALLTGTRPASEHSYSSERKQGKSLKLVYSKIYRLGDCLLIRREKVTAYLVSALIKHQKYDIALELCRELVQNYPTSESSRTLISVVLHFYSNLNSIQGLNIDLIDTIYQLLCMSLAYCDEDLIDQYHYLWHPTSFLNVINRLCHQHSILSTSDYISDAFYNWRFSAVYNDEGFNLEPAEIYNLVENFQPEYFKVLDSKVNAADANIVDDFINAMGLLLKTLRNKGLETSALRAVFFLLHYGVSDGNEGLESVIIEIIHSIQQRAIDRKYIDTSFILGLLYVLGEKNGFFTLKKLLRRPGMHAQRIKAIANIGIEFGLLVNNVEATSVLRHLHNKMQLISNQPTSSLFLEEVLGCSDAKASWKIVRQIMRSPQTNLSTIYLCSEAFNVDSNAVLLEYLNYLLLGSQAKHWAHAVEVPEREIDEVLTIAEQVIKDISDQDLLLNILKNLLERVDPYNHEVLLFICEQLSLVAANVLTVSSGYIENRITILKFLKMYKRISPPCDSEINQYLSLSSGDCNLPGISSMDSKLPAVSSVRLPFHFLMQEGYHKIINREMSSKTVTVWQKVAPLLKISTDDLIMITVKNTVNDYLEKMKKFSYSTFNYDITYLSTVNNLIIKISDQEKAAASANWIIKRMPPGENRKALAMIAVKCTEEWLKNSPSSEIALKTLRKCQYFFLFCVVETVLLKYCLNDDESVGLSTKPRQLTEYLVETHSVSIEGSRKVFQALEEINMVEIFSTDIKLFDVYQTFLFKWLSPSQNITQRLEETFCSANFDEEKEENLDSKNLLRAIYFLLGAPESVSSDLLHSISTKFYEMSNAQRSRALFCVFSVSDAQAIACFGTDGSQPGEYLASLMNVAELESIGLPCSVEMFASCNKLKLVEKILSKRVKNPKVLVFCARMNLEYNIWDSCVWKVILEQMKSLSMTEELQKVLQSSQGYLAHIWHSNEFASAWASVLYSLLKNDSMKSSKEVISKMYRTALRCPCLAFLNINLLWEEMTYVVPELKEKVCKPVTDACTFILALKEMLYGDARAAIVDESMTVSFCHIPG